MQIDVHALDVHLDYLYNIDTCMVYEIYLCIKCTVIK